MTAAASLKAASALVIGAGVTGLQAASVFKRQGCRVTILDISPHAEELAKSVGAGFSMAQSRDELAALLMAKVSSLPQPRHRTEIRRKLFPKTCFHRCNPEPSL